MSSGWSEWFTTAPSLMKIFVPRSHFSEQCLLGKGYIKESVRELEALYKRTARLEGD